VCALALQVKRSRGPKRLGAVVTTIRRDMLVTPDESEWIIQRGAADATSASLRAKDPTSGSLQWTHSEGHACRARRIRIDNPIWRTGPDKQVPPKGESEGHVYRARRGRMDHPRLCGGRDKQVPPRGGIGIDGLLGVPLPCLPSLKTTALDMDRS